MSRRTTRDWALRLRGALRPSRPAAPDFDRLASTWDVLGTCDPLWAILTRPGTGEGRWDVEEFFRSGQEQVDAALGLVEGDIGWSLNSGAALDFGCGVGRLTQALCRRFEVVQGVDIAPSMIEAAEQFNRYGDRCHYHVNIREDLAMFPDASFDFIYSTYVLQHMHPVFARGYVQEFVRLLAPRGVALFQIPTAEVRSASNRPMPDAWFVGEQELVGALPAQLPAGERSTLRVRVTNRSPGVWPSHGKHAVRVGTRWREQGSAVGAESRGNLPADLGPGDQATVDLDVSMPRRSGRYVLECGLLQEGVAWFEDKGGSVMSREVEVVGSVPETPEGEDQGVVDVPAMEMYATPREEVTGWVSAAGGRILRTEDAPPDENYEGCLFAVTRDQTPPRG
jgi:SAM-dependent methyltransferase